MPVTSPSGTTPAVSRSARRTSRSVLRTWLILGVVGVGFVVCAFTLAVEFGGGFGLRTTLLGLLLALLPLGIVVPTFLWLDRFEAEPVRLLVMAFLWGALVSAVLAAFVNTGAYAMFRETVSPEAALATTAVVVAPLVEEASKGALILVIWWFHRREFDGITDGMVYAGITAAGFAFTENIQYLSGAFTEGGGGMLAGVLILRGVMSPFAHPMFTVLTGIGIGVAATSTRRWVRTGAPVVGYSLAVLAHAMWNLAAVSGASGMLTVYAFVGIPIFVGFITLVVWTRHREGRLIGRFLSPYADAGWLAPGEVAMLASMPRRREARLWARTNAGASGLKSMRAFQDAASELALLRARMHHTLADDMALATEQELLAELVGHRRVFTGHTAV